MRRLLGAPPSRRRRLVRSAQIALLAVALAGLATLIALNPRHDRRPAPKTPPEIARSDRARADELYGKTGANDAYRRFIDKYRSSPDPLVQEEVTAAKLRLAYLAAKVPPPLAGMARAPEEEGARDRSENSKLQTQNSKLERARRLFLDAAATYKGTGAVGGDFGGLKDQALYQAAVCLSAQGKSREARTALVDFIRTQPYSPLVTAAYKRIVKIDGRATREDDRLIQHALDLQQRKIRHDTALCGPRAVEYLLALPRPQSGSPLRRGPGGGDSRLDQIARECGMADDGTSMDGLRRCLKLHGLAYYGFEVAIADLPHIPTPAIMFTGDHYLVITKASAKTLTAYDPMLDRETDMRLKDLRSPRGAFAFLLTSPPEVDD